MKLTHPVEEIRKDVEDLEKIILEDKIPIKELNTLYNYTCRGTSSGTSSIEYHLNRQVIISDIICRPLMTRRFADKMISLISKYDNKNNKENGKEELKLLIECTLLRCSEINTHY
jgi:hypothetical protein